MTDKSLPDRLREIRQDLGLTQREVAALLRPDAALSVSLISSWEKQRGSATPGDEWLDRLALIHAGEWTRRGEDPRVLNPQELTEVERERYRDLLDELQGLRGVSADHLEVIRSPSEQPARFWAFDDDLPITIIASALPDSELDLNPYANPRHPNYMPLLAFSDGDAVMEVYGHLRAENPQATVRYMRPSEVRANPDSLGGHVVIIGGGDYNEYSEWFAERMNLPVGAGVGDESPEDPALPYADASFTVRERDPETGEFLGDPVTYEPTFEGTVRTTVLVKNEDGAVVRSPRIWPKLVYDLALVARQPNPANLEATATLCYGLYSRGTFGAVRIFTDPLLAPGNERYRRERFGDSESYWFLVRVACNWGIATTPDLRRPYLRLRDWHDTDGESVR